MEENEEEENVNPPEWWSVLWWRWFLTILLASVLAGGLFFFANWRIAVNARRAAERERRAAERERRAAERERRAAERERRAAERERRAAEREQRINSVVDAYVNVVTASRPQYKGISALLVAGGENPHALFSDRTDFTRINTGDSHRSPRVLDIKGLINLDRTPTALQTKPNGGSDGALTRSP